jgi:hypothetical protein
MKPSCKILGILSLILFSSRNTAVVLASPQLCYYDDNKLAMDEIIPCYTGIKTDHYPCCKVNSMCLRNSACYDPISKVTYQYGCTDPTYQHESCPKKCNLRSDVSKWTGLVFCDGKNNMPRNKWICHDPENCGGISDCATKPWDDEVENLHPTIPTNCDTLNHDEKYVAFNDTNPIREVIKLPERQSLSSWWVEHTDQLSTVQSASVSVTAIASTTTGAGAAATSSNKSAHSSSSKTATTIGLAVGLGVGIPLLLIIAALTFFCLRRQRKNKNNTTLNPDPAIASPHTMPPAYDYPGEEKDIAASHGHIKAELDGTPNIGSPGPSEMQDTSVVCSP